MDYLGLYESFSTYRVGYANNTEALFWLGIFCAVGGVITLLLCALEIKENKDMALIGILGMAIGACGFLFIATNKGRVDETNNKFRALNSAAFEGCGDSIENVVYNVELLNDKYNERLDYFKFVYGDDAPSRKEYINNMLNEFYGQTVSSDRVNYRDEIKEVEQSLRKGVQ